MANSAAANRPRYGREYRNSRGSAFSVTWAAAPSVCRVPAVAGRMGRAPAPRGLDDHVDVFKGRFPPQRALDLVARRVEDARIARTPPARARRHGLPRHALDGAHDFADGRGT